MELFRYRRIDAQLRDLVVSGSSWFASPKSFNDPYDCQLPIRFDPTQKQFVDFLKSSAKRAGLPRKEILRKFRATEGEGPEAFRARMETAQRALLSSNVERSSMMCFSLHQADTLMFSHYGEDHKGVSVGFDANWLVATGKLAPVFYSDSFPELDYLKLRDRPDDLLKALYLTKAKKWEYEGEYRLIRANEPAGQFTFPLHVIQSITFGCECPSPRADDVKLWCRAANRNIRFFQAHRSATNFQLEVKDA